jgi:hypothetical protein
LRLLEDYWDAQYGINNSPTSRHLCFEIATIPMALSIEIINST